MKKIVLDTETTGLYPQRGHRVVEIGAVTLNEQGNPVDTFHVYLNPERSMPKEAYDIHGISSEFLANQPKFSEIADAFLKFIDGAHLIMHNAAFDMRFINHELFLIQKNEIPNTCVIDTLKIARTIYPGERVNLDALCRRFNIDLAERTFHGALKDAKLLAEVYNCMTQSVQKLFTENTKQNYKVYPSTYNKLEKKSRTVQATENEIQAHNFMKTKIPNAAWNKINL